MKLKEFVEIINKQEEFSVKNVGPDNAAKEFANAFIENRDKTDEELERIIMNKDITNENIIMSAKIILNSRKNNGKYKYNQTDDLYADVDVCKPYLDGKILNQKWHVLISLLAYVDLASCDEDCKESYYNFGEIKEIKEIRPTLKIEFEKTTKSYKSTGMNEFINKAIENFENNGI